MAKMDIDIKYIDDDENQYSEKVKEDLIRLFRLSARLITDDFLSRSNLHRKLYDFISLKGKANLQKVSDELEKMEKDELLILSEKGIKFTEKGKNMFFN